MKLLIFNSNNQKLAWTLFLLLCTMICSAGCLDISFISPHSSDSSDISVTEDKDPEPTITPAPEENPDLAFPPDMPPQIRERLMREGKIPSPVQRQVTEAQQAIPNPVPTSYVIQGAGSLSDDVFIPSRESIYFSNYTSWSGLGNLNPVYAQTGIPLNSTIKELKIHAEKGPFSVSFTVHPKSTPLVSWAKITVLDPFQNILHEDGYNREFSSEQVKEFVVYREGNFTVRISGGYATLDISINTPDGQVQPRASATKSGREISEDMPPQLRERLMREGKL